MQMVEDLDAQHAQHMLPHPTHEIEHEPGRH
jgi:hypothetical protein